MASTHAASQTLEPDEYDAVALIYNDELSVLGELALYPICINTPVGTPAKPLVRYLRRGGYAVNDPSVCNPSLRHGDFPHGMDITIDKLQRDPDGQLDIHVSTGDNTIHVGVHFATLLRRGTYHLKQNEAGEWKIISYTKEYDPEDDKAKDKCDCAHPPPVAK